MPNHQIIHKKAQVVEKPLIHFPCINCVMKLKRYIRKEGKKVQRSIYQELNCQVVVRYQRQGRSGGSIMPATGSYSQAYWHEFLSLSIHSNTGSSFFVLMVLQEGSKVLVQLQVEAVKVSQLQAKQQRSIIIAVQCQRQVQFHRQIGTKSCHRVGRSTGAQGSNCRCLGYCEYYRYCRRCGYCGYRKHCGRCYRSIP